MVLIEVMVMTMENEGVREGFFLVVVIVMEVNSDSAIHEVSGKGNDW